MDRLLQLNTNEERAGSAAEGTTQLFTRSASEKRRKTTQRRPKKYNQTSPTPIRAGYSRHSWQP